MSNSFDVVVVGLGAMGSAALYQLSKTGNRVLGIDQFSPPHNLGSSHGDTRVTRQAIGEGRHYSPLVMKSHEIWREIEQKTRTELYSACGGLIFGNAQGSTRCHGVETFLEETIQAAKEHEIAHEVLETPELKKRFPQFSFRDGEIGYYEPEAGFVRPEQCIEMQLALAGDAGAEILTDLQVQDIQPVGDGVEVITAGSVFTAGRVVISAGAWITKFLPPQLHQHFSVFRQVLHWFETKDAIGNYAREHFPIYIRVGETLEEIFYGFPAIDGPQGGIKVATERFDVESDPDSLVREVTESERRETYELVSSYLQVSPSPVRSAVCMYTVTPDNDFIIDVLPDAPQIIIASPCSGHGFKHSAAIGLVLSDLALEKEPSLDISSFAFARFA